MARQLAFRKSRCLAMRIFGLRFETMGEGFRIDKVQSRTNQGVIQADNSLNVLWSLLWRVPCTRLLAFGFSLSINPFT